MTRSEFYAKSTLMVAISAVNMAFICDTKYEMEMQVMCCLSLISSVSWWHPLRFFPSFKRAGNKSKNYCEARAERMNHG